MKRGGVFNPRGKLLLLIWFISVPIIQGAPVNTGSITGRITDLNHDGLDGVTVTVRSAAHDLPSVVKITDDSGIFRFPALDPGIYSIEVRRRDLQPVVRYPVIVRSGRTEILNERMHPALIRSGKSTDIPVSIQRVDVPSIVSSDQIERLPSLNRNLHDFTRLNPGVVNGVIHGTPERNTRYNIDGFNVSDPTTGGGFNRISLDALQTIEVDASGTSAAYRGYGGGVINVITKTGSNDLHGSARFSFTGSGFRSDNTSGTIFEDTDYYEFDKFSNVEGSFTLGGPIVKDKLWFFTSLNVDRKTNTQFYYDPQGEQEVVVPRTSYTPFFHITGRVDPKNTFGLSTAFSLWGKDDNPYDASGIREDLGWRLNKPIFYLNSSWHHEFSDRFYADLRMGYICSQSHWKPNTEGYQIYDYQTGNVSGGSGYERWNGGRRLQFNLDLTRYFDTGFGEHRVQGGFEASTDRLWKKTDYFGDPDVNDMWQIYYQNECPVYGKFSADLDSKIGLNSIGFYLQDHITFGKLTASIGFRFDMAEVFYPKQNENEAPFDVDGVLIDRRISEKESDAAWEVISPRLSFTYDITGDGRNVVKLSAARYFHSNASTAFSWAWDAHPNYYLCWSSPLYPCGGILGPIQISKYPAIADVGFEDTDLKAPRTDIFTVGFSKALWEDWALGLRYIRKWDRNLVHAVDPYQIDIRKLLDDGTYDWIDYQQETFTDPYDGNTITFYNDLDPGRMQGWYYVNPDDARRDYDGVELTLKKRYSKGWSLNASYVFSNSRGLVATYDGPQLLGNSTLFQDPNAHINGVGRLKFNRPHQIKAYGTYDLPWGFQIGGYARWLSGNRYTRRVSSTYLDTQDIMNRDTSNNAEERGSRGLPSQFLIDLRLSKYLQISDYTLQIYADMFNVFNADTPTWVQTDSSSPFSTFEQETLIQDPRIFRLGAKIEF